MIFRITSLLLLVTFLGASSARAAENMWVAAAIGSTEKPNFESPGEMAVGMSRRTTREEAESAALASCRAKSPTPEVCKIINAFNRGCMYIARGIHPIVGTPAFGVSYTSPQEAYDNCHKGDNNCASPVNGGCADSNQDLPRQVSHAAHVPHWGAIAVGQGKSSSYEHVFSGVAFGTTASEAAAKAEANCNEGSPIGGSYCRAVSTFNQGCGYISLGTAGVNGSGVGWGTGPSAQVAYDGCTSRGFECQTRTSYYCANEFKLTVR